MKTETTEVRYEVRIRWKTTSGIDDNEHVLGVFDDQALAVKTAREYFDQHHHHGLLYCQVVEITEKRIPLH